MELRQSSALNLHPMVEDRHTNRRDQKKNKNAPDAAPDMAKKIAAPNRAGFPLPLDSNPLVFHAGTDFHALPEALFMPLRCAA